MTTLAPGALLRDEGAAAADEAAGFDWRATADDVIAALVAEGRPFTADNVRERMRGYPDPPSPNAWGGRLLSWARSGEIVRVGYRSSGRRAAHHRVVTIWRAAA